MCSSKIGFCGGLVQFVLAIVNLIFLTIGSAIIIVTSLIRFGSFDVSRVIRDENLQNVLNISSLDTVAVVLLSLGAFIVFISVLGLIGVCCASRHFLVIYDISVAVLLVSHLIFLLILLVKKSDVEDVLRVGFREVVKDINKNYPFTSTAHNRCNAMKTVSSFLDCCGAQSPFDFKDGKELLCCKVTSKSSRVVSKQGCSSKLVEYVQSNLLHVVLIPNGVFIAFELFVLMLVPVLIGKLRPVRQISIN